MIDATDRREREFLVRFETALRNHNLVIRRRIPLSDGAGIYHIDWPGGVDLHYWQEISARHISQANLSVADVMAERLFEEMEEKFIAGRP